MLIVIKISKQETTDANRSLIFSRNPLELILMGNYSGAEHFRAAVPNTPLGVVLWVLFVVFVF